MLVGSERSRSLVGKEELEGIPRLARDVAEWDKGGGACDELTSKV
jgi:hypothetical protein